MISCALVALGTCPGPDWLLSRAYRSFIFSWAEKPVWADTLQLIRPIFAMFFPIARFTVGYVQPTINTLANVPAIFTANLRVFICICTRAVTDAIANFVP